MQRVSSKERELATQARKKAVFISHSANTLGNGIHYNIPPPAIGIAGQTMLLKLVWQEVLFRWVFMAYQPL